MAIEKKTRPSIDEYFMSIADVTSHRSTCRHRWQGVVLVKVNHIISTGYNGSPPSQPHCIDLGYCAKANKENCRAEGLHGESNAIASAARIGISTEGATAYCIYSPCLQCCNLMKSAGIAKVVFRRIYEGFTKGPQYLSSLGIDVYHYRKEVAADG